MLKIFTGSGFEDLDDDVIICPEHKLHPHFFEEYVKKMCKKALNENISIFTYNPMLIEFFEVLSKYYETDIKFLFVNAISEIEEIDWCDMSDYLATKVYDVISIYQFKVERGKTVSNDCSCCCKIKNGGECNE